VFGYGLVIPHHGTIEVGDQNRVGNYAVLHSCVCISAKEKIIGNGLYCSTGAKIIGNVSLGDWVTLGANAVVNRSFGDYCLLTGVPAEFKKNKTGWAQGKYADRMAACEKLKKKWDIPDC